MVGKDKALTFILPALVCLSMAIWYQASTGPGKPVPVKKNREVKEADALKNELASMVKKFKKTDGQADAEGMDWEWGRNPFYLEKEFEVKEEEAVADDPGNREPVLNGIFWDDENPSAVINNRYVAVNDTFGGYTVMAIQKNVVILSDGMDHIELRTGLY